MLKFNDMETKSRLFTPYETPKLGVFSIETGEYKLPTGWLCKDMDFKIIGEDDISYICQENDEIVSIHKSSLVKFKDIQLNLF